MTTLIEIKDRPVGVEVVGHGTEEDGWVFTTFVDCFDQRYVKKQRHMGSKNPQVKWYIEKGR
jgi:hypothetical protein